MKASIHMRPGHSDERCALNAVRGLAQSESSDVDVDVENDSANEGAPARSRRRPRGSDDEGVQ
jgi:hypothetical protein